MWRYFKKQFGICLFGSANGVGKVISCVISMILIMHCLQYRIIILIIFCPNLVKELVIHIKFAHYLPLEKAENQRNLPHIYDL